MCPERMNADQRLLYEVLMDIWQKQSRRIVVYTMSILALCLGVVLGMLYGTRQSMRQAAKIAVGLQTQVSQNREMIEGMARDRTVEQQRYLNLLAAFENVKRSAQNAQKSAKEKR